MICCWFYLRVRPFLGISRSVSESSSRLCCFTVFITARGVLISYMSKPAFPDELVNWDLQNILFPVRKLSPDSVEPQRGPIPFCGSCHGI